MTALPTPADVAHLPDDELLQLAHQWRTQAAHGVREAFGVAHTLEVEYRRRLRMRDVQTYAAEPIVEQRASWWQAIWHPVRGASHLSAS